MRSHIRPVIAAALLLGAGCACAQQAIVYPAQGQSPQQQAQDQAECNAWAQQSTGVDPVAIAQQSSSQPPPSGPQGERARGALRGAAAGALIGEVAGNDAGEGAAVGAVVGTMAGGRRQRQRAAQEQSAVQQQQAQAQQALATYQRAVTACMEGRHYVVK